MLHATIRTREIIFELLAVNVQGGLLVAGGEHREYYLSEGLRSSSENRLVRAGTSLGSRIFTEAFINQTPSSDARLSENGAYQNLEGFVHHTEHTAHEDA